MSIELEDTIRAQLQSAGVSGEELVQRATETFLDGRVRELATDPPPAAPRSERVELRDIVGRGGMGTVYGGTQRSLSRRVAVKTLREDRTDPRERQQLLREAFVTGAIEHPNVVPVHDLELTEDGQVLVILKHVEGVSWSTLIHDPPAAAELAGGRPHLEWNVDVLGQIANAVRYAHRCGFVHRDLKPDNVLIGRYGEVYLADWGIAVRLEDDGSGRFPLARDSRGLCGTPAYMPPEMLGGRQDELGPQTDVYLLGALLYEIVVGKPPHVAGTLPAMLRSVSRSAPELPANVDPELAAIVRRAMARSSADRYPDVEALTSALAEYRSHRHSARLAADADARCEELLELLMEGSLDDEHNPTYRRLSETRFGYRQALDAWPDNVAATRGLSRLVEAMIARELAMGRPRAAAALLSDHPDPSDALRERIRDARRRATEREQKLGRLEEEFDPDVSRSNRYPFLIFTGVLCAGVPGGIGALVQMGVLEDTFAAAIATSGFLLIATSLLIVWTSRRAQLTIVSKRVVGTIVVALGAQVLLFAADWALGSTPSHSMVRMLLVFAVIMVIVAAHYTPLLLIGAGAFLVAHFVGLFRPEWRFYLVGAASFVFALNMLQVRRWAIRTYGAIAPDQ